MVNTMKIGTTLLNTSILGVLAFTDPLITSAGLTATGFVANVAVIVGEPYRSPLLPRRP